MMRKLRWPCSLARRLERWIIHIAFGPAAVEGGSGVGIEVGALARTLGQVRVGDEQSPECNRVGPARFDGGSRGVGPVVPSRDQDVRPVRAEQLRCEGHILMIDVGLARTAGTR